MTLRDEAPDDYSEWECQDFSEAVEGIRKGYEDVKGGNVRLAVCVLEDLRRKYDIPR
ncbi:MAG TPA: hypothetical protein VJO35_18650 [Terriglobales bacterium]|nr:hypothetical protein [Terriglobales bacterium]